jgi:hypothetical protein
MQFIHAIDLQNWYPCHNLVLSGCLHSPNALAFIDQGIGEQHQPIDNTPVEDLAQGLYPPSVITPRAMGEVVRAGILRNGQQIANGFNEVELISEETKRAALHCSDVELLFETVRRQVAPASPSRLSCLYLAERADVGEQMLRNMLGQNVYILRVVPLVSLQLARVDSAWFDDFFESRDPENVRKYWLGQQMGEVGRWEYLFDGVIKAEDPEQIEHIRKHGARLWHRQ